MGFVEYLRQEHIAVGLVAQNKRNALEHMARLFHQSGGVSDPNLLANALMDREATRTTGIGNGVAIPHVKSNVAPKPIIGLGVAKSPIDFQSVDGRPVTFIWVLVSPATDNSQHIQLLAKISRLMTANNSSLLIALKEATSNDQLYSILCKAMVDQKTKK